MENSSEKPIRGFRKTSRMASGAVGKVVSDLTLAFCRKPRVEGRGLRGEISLLRFWQKFGIRKAKKS